MDIHRRAVHAMVTMMLAGMSCLAQAQAGIGEAPEYLTYMSARCSALHDAVRTASARGLDYKTQGEMRRNYQRECAEDESEARSKWSRERGEKKQLVRSEADAARR